MNAGKSTVLLQAAWNYRERGMSPQLYTAAIDNRDGADRVTSRIGIEAEARTFTQGSDLFLEIGALGTCHAVLFDEAQFLTDLQVWQLAKVCDELSIPVLCYGLRTDFQGKLFPGSAALLAIADNLREIRTICWCGSKATMTLRLDPDGKPVEEGEQVAVGGNESYISLCRKHWRSGELGK